MTWGWVNYQQMFFLKVNYSFKANFRFSLAFSLKSVNENKTYESNVC